LDTAGSTEQEIKKEKRMNNRDSVGVIPGRRMAKLEGRAVCLKRESSPRGG